MCLETLGQFRSEENGSIECTSRQCRLKCDEGYQAYGAKSTIKCIRTKKVLFSLNFDETSSEFEIENLGRKYCILSFDLIGTH